VGHDHRGAIVLRQKWLRGEVETRLASLPPCRLGMEACVGAQPQTSVEALIRLGIFQKFSQVPPGTGSLAPERGAPQPA
jgi:hypothetical protein